MSQAISRLLSAITGVLLLASCTTTPTPAVYRVEKFEVETPYQLQSDLPPLMLCEYGKRALLSQGYEVDASSPQNIRGSKFFQPQSDNQVQLRITLVCLQGKSDSTIYANALQTRYELKSGGSSTGLSVAGLGSISLPWLPDKSSLVKVGEETVNDPDFYKRLFALIELLME